MDIYSKKYEEKPCFLLIIIYNTDKVKNKGAIMNEDIDFKYLIRQFILRLSLVTIMIIILYCFGNTEIIRWFHNYETRDFGSFIMLIGISMGVACLFDTTQPFFSVKPFNLICSVAIYIFGYTLNEYGIMSAANALGILALIIAYFSAPLSRKIAGISFITGVCIIVISWIPLPNYKTKIPPQPNRPVDIVTEWSITLGDEHYGTIELPPDELSIQTPDIKGLKHPISDYTQYTTGTEESIIKNAQMLLKKYIEANPDKKLDFISIQCSNIPQSYSDQYGLPVVYFHYKYINRDGSIKQINSY